MSNIKITCDSTCDLPQELYQKYDVDVVSMTVLLGDTARRDGIDITSEELVQYTKDTGLLPKTSAISLGEYLDVFGPYVRQGRPVIHISLSSDLSVSHHNAVLAAQELGNVYVIDSRNLSSGSGHLVIEAALMAQQGMAAQDIADRLNEMKERLDVSFVLQTLEFLQKGGRCSSVTALGARALQLRPEIRVHDGGMTVGKKYRGTLKKVLPQYVKDKLAQYPSIKRDHLFITYSTIDPSYVELVRQTVEETMEFKEIHTTNASCTIACHCGPNTLGILFETE